MLRLRESVGSAAGWVVARRRSRGSCAATRRLVIAMWSIGQRLLSGTRTGVLVARRSPSWLPTTSAHVYCTELDHGRFPWIERFGGTPLDGCEEADPVARILDRHRLGVDAVFECAGAKEVVPQGVRMLRNGGFYGLVGLVHPDSALTVNAEVIIRKCLTLRGVHNYGPSHLDEAMEFLLRFADVLPFGDLVSPPVPLSRLEDAVDLAKSRRWLRVSVTM